MGRLGTDLAKRLGTQLGTSAASLVDVFVQTGALAVWRANEALDNGSVTTTIVPLIGTTQLARRGTGQSIKAISAFLNSQPTIVLNGINASGGYFGVPLAAAPIECTLLTVARCTGAVASGWTVVTAAGLVNSGFGQLSFSGSIRTRKLATDPSLTPFTAPANIAILSLVYPAGTTHYVNTLAPLSGITAGALVGTTLDIADFDSTGLGTMPGEWALSAIWARRLTQAEVAQVMRAMGEAYGIPIAGTSTGFAPIVALAAGRPVFNGDYYIIDGTSGKVRSIVDWNDPLHVLDQSNAALQVALALPHADFAGHGCFTFTGAEYYISNRAASNFVNHHNGVGEECVLVCTPVSTASDQRAASTRTTGATVGFNLGVGGGGGEQFVGNAAGVFINLSGGVVSSGAPTYLTCSYVKGRSPEAALYNKTTLALSTSNATVPDAGAPVSSLTLGATATGFAPFIGRVAALVLAPTLDAATRSALSSALVYYGFPSFAPIVALAAGRPVFNADSYVVDGISGKVRSLVDWSNPARVLDQSDTSKQCALPAAHADFQGRLCLTFTGVEYYVSNQPAPFWAFMVDGTGFEFFHTLTRALAGTHVYQSTGNASSNNSLLYVAGASLAFELYASPTQVYSRTRTPPAVDVPSYFNGFYVEGGSPETSLRVKGGAADTGTSALVPPLTPSAPLTLGANSIGLQQAVMRWRELILSPPLTAAQEAVVQQYILAAYGVSP